MSKKARRDWVKQRLQNPVLSLYIKYQKNRASFDVSGQETITELLDSGKIFIPCYWHQQNMCCPLYLLEMKHPNFKPGFLISPSVDGDSVALLFKKWGAQVIRGSSNRTGAEALRDLYKLISKDKVSAALTPDGPKGPRFEIKPGVLLLAQMTQIPLLPIAGAPENHWQLNTWDRFMLPKLTGKFRIRIGQPVTIPRNQSLEELKPIRLELQSELNRLTASATLAS